MFVLCGVLQGALAFFTYYRLLVDAMYLCMFVAVMGVFRKYFVFMLIL